MQDFLFLIVLALTIGAIARWRGPAVLVCWFATWIALYWISVAFPTHRPLEAEDTDNWLTFGWFFTLLFCLLVNGLAWLWTWVRRRKIEHAKNC